MSLIDRLPHSLKASRKTILFAVLNWGLGHAARSIPVINLLVKQGHQVIITSDGIALELLQKECPDLVFEEAPAYNINYKSGSMSWSMILQTSKILKAVLEEKQQVKELIKKYNVDYIISDHRFGYSSQSITSVFIGHQLKIQSNFSFLSWAATRANSFWINKFDHIWVPDYQDRRLSGKLSDWPNLDKLRFIGPLTRLKYVESKEKDNDILIILSGVEPKRSLLEEQLESLLSNTSYSKILIRGSQSAYEKGGSSIYSEIIKLADTSQVTKLISRSKLVICRSGYSSIMDLDATESKAILIPTPGQTEQEYLAGYIDSDQIKSIKEEELKSKLLISIADMIKSF